MSLGKLKTTPEDFRVFEVLPLPPAGDPEPACRYYKLRKCNYTTFEAVQLIAERCEMPSGAIGYAGLKDEDGITEQHLSLPRLLSAPELEAVRRASHGRAGAFIELVHLRGGSHPLTVGKLAGNEFHLVVRDLDAATAEALRAQRCWTSLFVNYYGPQRFGLPNEPKSTPQIGDLLLNERWEAALELVRTLSDEHGSRARSFRGEPEAFFDALDPRVRAFYLSSLYSRDWNERLAAILHEVCGARVRSEVHDSIPYDFPIERAQKLELLGRCRDLPYIAVRAQGGTLVHTRKSRTTAIVIRIERHRLFTDDVHQGRWACELRFFLPSGCYATIAVPQFVADVQSGLMAGSDPGFAELETLYELPAEVPNWRPVAGRESFDRGFENDPVLFRSGLPVKMSEGTAQRLRGAFGVSCYVDLRTAAELDGNGELSGLRTALEWTHFPIASAAELRGAEVPTHHDYARDYIRTLDENGPQFAALMTFLADSDHHGYAIGCRAGKDRTGLAVMVLLAAVGAPREIILADYEASTEPLRRGIAHFSDSWEKRSIGRDEYGALHLVADARAMEPACIHLDERYGGAAEYLVCHGMTADAVGRLRHKFGSYARDFAARISVASEAGS